MQQGQSFDTLAFARQLKDAGYSAAQAEGLAEAQNQLVRPMHDSIAAVQRGLQAVEADMVRLRAEMQALRAEFKAELAALRAEFKVELAALESRMFRLFAGQTVILAGLIFAAARYL